MPTDIYIPFFFFIIITSQLLLALFSVFTTHPKDWTYIHDATKFMN